MTRSVVVLFTVLFGKQLTVILIIHC